MRRVQELHQEPGGATKVGACLRVKPSHRLQFSFQITWVT